MGILNTMLEKPVEKGKNSMCTEMAHDIGGIWS